MLVKNRPVPGLVDGASASDLSGWTTTSGTFTDVYILPSLVNTASR